MNRRTLSLFLAFSVVLCDGLPLFALTCRTAPQAVDCILADTTDDAVREDEQRPVFDQPVRQVLCEPIEECDSDELSDAHHFASTFGFLHYEFRFDFCLPVRYATTSCISTNLRI